MVIFPFQSQPGQLSDCLGFGKFPPGCLFFGVVYKKKCILFFTVEGRMYRNTVNNMPKIMYLFKQVQNKLYKNK